MSVRALLIAVLGLASPAVAQTPAPQSAARMGVDAPELAPMGAFAVGVANVEFVQKDQLDPYQGETEPAKVDRRLNVTVWYPAAPNSGPPTVYRGALTGENGRDVAFTIPGLAVRAAPAAGGRYPMLLLAHGSGDNAEVTSWLCENLASKGYVVVVPNFGDPPYGDRTRSMWPLVRRPLDVAFTAAEAQRRARAGEAPFAQIDSERVAVLGYSLGGYGALAGAGAELDPALGPATRGILTPYVAGGPRAAELKIQGLKALIGVAPAGRFTPQGSAAITVPTLYISGDMDNLVSYQGVREKFESQTRAPRYLLTFKNAGHQIIKGPAPAEMRTSLWDQDWFEDSVWRKDRLNSITAHFVTAFLDRYLKGDESKAAYLELPNPESSAGTWTAPASTPWDARSPGAPAATLWKGFQRNHAWGLKFEYRPAAP
jgi:predicted dienelactone hydrolase